MNTQPAPKISDRFNPATEKYEYICIGHIGDELLKQRVFSEFKERVLIVERTHENNLKVTRGYL